MFSKEIRFQKTNGIIMMKSDCMDHPISCDYASRLLLRRWVLFLYARYSSEPRKPQSQKWPQETVLARKIPQ